MDYKIIKRSLSEKEIELLIKEVKTTPNIIGYTKREWSKFKNIWVAETENELVGVLVAINLPYNWIDIAVLYVLKPYRNKGIGRELIDTTTTLIETKGNNLYMVSSNPMVIKNMEEINMTLVNSPFKLPLAIQLFNIRYALNLFRIYEAIRKAVKMKREHRFVYGYKYSKHN